MTSLQAGDPAPDFVVPDQDGKPVSLKNFRGKKLIIFFYPRDNTPGCIREACNLRDNYSKLRKLGYAVRGVSADNERSHQRFISKFKLPFTLLADTEKKMLNDYGVWGEKKFMGLTYIGVRRTTFVIDEKGVIEKVIDKVKTGDHTAQVLSSE